jgi:hypothetical protein
MRGARAKGKQLARAYDISRRRPRAADAVAQALIEFALLFRPQSGGDG